MCMRSSKATRPESARLSGGTSTNEERNALVAEYRASQLSVKAFAQIKGFFAISSGIIKAIMGFFMGTKFETLNPK